MENRRTSVDRRFFDVRTRRGKNKQMCLPDIWCDVVRAVGRERANELTLQVRLTRTFETLLL